MKKIIFLIAVFTISINYAQQTAATIESENRECLENTTPATISTVECENRAKVAWENLMNELYLQLKEHPRQASASLLFDSQTHWVRFQQADLAYYRVFYHNLYEGGTMTLAAVASHEKNQFRERALYLLAFLEELQEE
ncbi:MAG: lysozyme inhibitor LprI family protein [Bacteroidota bacterium]